MESVIMTNELKRRIEAIVDRHLSFESLEDFLERFDLSPEDVVLQLYEAGQLDPDIIEELE
jgi:hypothetical protein